MSRPFEHSAAVPADVETAFAVLTGPAWPAALASQLPGSELVSARMSLLPAGSGSTWTVEGSVRVRVPVLGGRIEAYVAPLLERLLTLQGDVLRAQSP